MKTFYKIILVLFFSTFIIAQNTSKKFYEMSKEEIHNLLIEKSSKELTVTERMNYFSELFLEMPYSLHGFGDGRYALYDTNTLLSFDSTNCMVFCEVVLALSISDDYENFFNNLQQIRYKNGIIGMKTRNHYTMADWLPENSWLLRDVVKEVAGAKTKTITRTISHKTFFAGKGIKDMRHIKEDRTMTIDYIPFDVLPSIKDKIKDGDILVLLFKNLDNIFSAHMLMAYDTPNGKVIREAALGRSTTFDTPYDEWVAKYQNSKKHIGIALMRVNDDLNKKGKIILPWEISKMREGKK